jgi:hypothetical protein
MSVKGDGTVLAGSIAVGKTSVTPGYSTDINGNLAVGGQVDVGASAQSFFRTNGAGASEFGGAAASNHTAVFSKGAEAMRIDSAGKVGIGTTTPSQTLTVNGTFSYAITQNDVTSLRTVTGTVYRNTTGRIMYVSVMVGANGNNSAFAYSDSNPSPTTLVSRCSTLMGYSRLLFFIVVPGNYYKVSNDGTLSSWIEWY